MIAVTGGNGLLGSFVIEELLKSNTPCIGLRRENSINSGVFKNEDKIQWKIADVLNPVQLEESFEGISTVIHTAAKVDLNPWHRKEVMEVNVQGTKNVVDACLNAGVKNILHVSSVAALGKPNELKVIDESQTWIPGSSNSSYGESKFLSELEIYRGKEEGLKVIIINPSVILAPGNWNSSSARMFKYVWDENLFYFDRSINYVDVRDVVKGIMKLLPFSMAGERFILNGGKVSALSLLKRMALHFGKRPPRFQLKGSWLGGLARLEEYRSLIFGGNPLITRDTTQQGGREIFYDNQKAKNVLGLDFQELEETVEWCCAYYLNNQSNKN